MVCSHLAYSIHTGQARRGFFYFYCLLSRVCHLQWKEWNVKVVQILLISLQSFSFYYDIWKPWCQAQTAINFFSMTNLQMVDASVPKGKHGLFLNSKDHNRYITTRSDSPIGQKPTWLNLWRAISGSVKLTFTYLYRLFKCSWWITLILIWTSIGCWLTAGESKLMGNV